jgi:hypothetical protein
MKWYKNKVGWLGAILAESFVIFYPFHVAGASKDYSFYDIFNLVGNLSQLGWQNLILYSLIGISLGFLVGNLISKKFFKGKRGFGYRRGRR